MKIEIEPEFVLIIWNVLLTLVFIIFVIYVFRLIHQEQKFEPEVSNGRKEILLEV